MPQPNFFNGPPGPGSMTSGPMSQGGGMSGPPPPSTAKLVNGFSAERAKMLGLL